VKKANKTEAIERHEEETEAIVQIESAEIPDYLVNAPEEPIRGAENVEPGDFIMPRLSICGKQSPQFDENNERYIAGLKMGQFFNSVTGEIYGNQIYVVPLMEVKTRAIFRAYGEDGPPLCVSSDGKTGEGVPGGECRPCQERQFMRNEQGKSVKPRCTEIMSYAVLVMPKNAEPAKVWAAFPRLESISMIGFKSTSIGSAKTWNTLLKLRNRDWFAGVYLLTSVAQSDGKNSWYIPKVENAGWQSEEGYKACLPCYESIKDMFSSGRARVDEFTEREPGADG
jgi:hypothetical protein